MINIADNFNLAGSSKPLDGRDEFTTVAEMKACTVCNEKHICYVRENQKQYQFSSSNTLDSTTGYWREYTVGSGSGDVTGATVGGTPVTKSGGTLQFPAYPTVPIKGIKDSNGNDINPDSNGKVTLPAASAAPISKIKVDGASDDLPINDGRVVIPSTPVKGIKTNGGTDLTPDSNGKVTLPPIPADPSSRLTNIENTLQQIANSEPIVIPVSAIELPTSSSNPFTYDSDDTYVMNISGTQVATVHYPYTVGSTDYVAFKAIDRDLYYVYVVESNGITYTYSNQYTWSTLPTAAKAKFESGIYAVKQTINNDGSIPEGHWVHGVPSTFVTRHNYPLRYRQITETVGGSTVYYILIKNDEINKIYKYQSSTQNNIAIWSQVTGGCYTKGDNTTGANYNKYDKFFDRKDASDVDFNNTGTGLNGTTVQAVIGEIANKVGYAVNPQATINTNPTKNEYYDFTANAISSLDVHDISITNTNEILVLFLTSSNGCSLTLSTSQRIIGSTSLANSQVYIMSILRGVICLVEAPAYVQVTSLSSTPESE